MNARPDTRPNRLYKSATDRVLFGVCGGLGDYFAVDPVLVRVAFVVLTLANGLGLLVYLILAIVLPKDEPRDDEVANLEADDAADTEGRQRTVRRRRAANPAQRRNGLGLLLVVGGLILLLANLNVLWWLNWSTLWPLLLIAIGAAIILTHMRRS